MDIAGEKGDRHNNGLFLMDKETLSPLHPNSPAASITQVFL
jgi:hypothetical protein